MNQPNCPLSSSACRTLCPSTRISRTSTPEICTCGSGTTGTGPSAAYPGPKWTWCSECPTTTTGLLSKEQKKRNLSLCFGRVWMEEARMEWAALVALVKEGWTLAAPPLLGAVGLSLCSVLCTHGCRWGDRVRAVWSQTENQSSATQGIKQHTPPEKALFSLLFSPLSTSSITSPLP